jgi:hypothetical protein
VDDTLKLRFAALSDPHDDSDWLDVVRRAGAERRRSRAWLAVPLAAALVALLAGSAFAYYADIVHFGSAEKAPPETLHFFEVLSVAVPPRFEDPQVVLSEARRFDVPTVHGRRAVRLFLAPARTGGFCTSWGAPVNVGGCQPADSGPLGVKEVFSAGRDAWIALSVNSQYVASVQVRFDDGAAVELPITWISPPIDRGFAVYEFTRDERERREAVVALDDDGQIVTQYRFGAPPTTGPPADAVFDERTAAVEVASRSGPAVMWLAPTRYETECAWLEIEEHHDGLCTMPLAIRSTPQTALVFGRVGDDDAIVDLRYADGDTDEVHAEDGIYLYEIPEEHLEPATALTSMTVRGADLEKEPWLAMTVAEWRGCKALPLPEGSSCPWGP